MNATRAKIAAQDRILDCIVGAFKSALDAEPEVAAEIQWVGAKLAKQWGIKHADLPDTRRSAGE